MIKRLIWTIWTPMSSVLKKADKLNLSLSLLTSLGHCFLENQTKLMHNSPGRVRFVLLHVFCEFELWPVCDYLCNFYTVGSRNGVPVRATLKISILWGCNNCPVRKLITCRDEIASHHGKQPRFLPKTYPIEQYILLVIWLTQSILCCSTHYCSWAATNHPST